MPKRTDIKKILLIGSGPIIIGQACEFDYSGTQACKALREEGYEVVLINSNPATIMTDPEFADKTYIEPITAEIIEMIIKKERPDAVLPTLGGQTGLNVAIELADKGILDKYNVEMLAAKADVIKKGEDRELFKKTMIEIGLDLPKSGYAKNLEDARKIASDIGTYPLIIRPSFTLGGTGGGIAYNKEEYETIVAKGIEYSPVSEVLIEESLLGWQEFELEVMRDKKDNVVIICSIENFDPMGIHTGDSITVAPAQTLSDKCYQEMRDASKKIIRAIGVETGGSNIQFAVNPANGRMVIIEMNPRVSRSSALASKATGFPIAKIAAKLAVGYTLDEIPNDITKETTACFEPSIDYCVVKIPRFAFEKFPGADSTLAIQMKSVGEVMSIGSTFKEAMQKAMRSLEIKRFGLVADAMELTTTSRDELRQKLLVPREDRISAIVQAFKTGFTVSDIFDLTKIDKWFLHNIKDIIDFEVEFKEKVKAFKDPQSLKNEHELFFRAKELGYSDVQIACLTGLDEIAVRSMRKEMGIEPVYKLVDTCAAEFEAYTPYYYSTYQRPFYHVDDAGNVAQITDDEVRKTDKKKIMILGGGPNRIGQGIEFDYCCVHASFALKEDGYETIMVNSNPETVSTDYDSSDKLYFEPLTFEDVLNIYEREECSGAIVQLGGQTPLNLALRLKKAGVNIIGTSPESIDVAENREKFQKMLKKLGLIQPANGTAINTDQAISIAKDIGYPVVVRPSYVLGGRAMKIVFDEASLVEYMTHAVKVSPDHPILVDKFLEDAVEIDVDAVSDGETVVVGAVMEHIEEAGIHSGDSACIIPYFSLSDEIAAKIKKDTHVLALELNVKGLMNIQFAVRNDVIYVLEVNPRASRTIPFVSKSIGVPLAKIAAKVMAGKTLKELGFTEEVTIDHFSVKEAVLPFIRFPGVDILLGPEMKSTGEVMGIDSVMGLAFAKSQMGTGQKLPMSGTVFISVKNQDKRKIVFIAKRLLDIGYKIVASSGTAKVFKNNGIDAVPLFKVSEGRPNILDYIKNDDIDLIINTPSGQIPLEDEVKIRSTAVAHNVPIITTLSAAQAVVNGIDEMAKRKLTVKALQEYHMGIPS
ncbi:MAG: carbamoyl-phosphate synthase large subunit [Candidatus Ancaeobacter aquaticus]|nr:carbamoyl-phosphate synthase large subunit [Candidatus Ancaeobacter aquaticus]